MKAGQKRILSPLLALLGGVALPFHHARHRVPRPCSKMGGRYIFIGILSRKNDNGSELHHFVSLIFIHVTIIVKELMGMNN